jgi:hypothetical protein
MFFEPTGTGSKHVSSLNLQMNPISQAFWKQPEMATTAKPPPITKLNPNRYHLIHYENRKEMMRGLSWHLLIISSTAFTRKVDNLE